MPANVESMAYYGEEPWHGLGNPVPKGVTAEEMIRAAGLDWKVELRPARGARKINKKGDFSRYEVVRVPRPNTSQPEALFGVVSRRYEPLQNLQAFEFFDLIGGVSKAHFETAGVLGEGERIWVLAHMPEPMEIVKGDECWRYLLLSNNHTGEGSVTIKFTPVRERNFGDVDSYSAILIFRSTHQRGQGSGLYIMLDSRLRFVQNSVHIRKVKS